MTKPQIVKLPHGLCAVIITHRDTAAPSAPVDSDPASPSGQRRAPRKSGGDPMPVPSATTTRKAAA